MSGAEKLKEKILAEASSQAESVLAEARKKAEAIVEAAKKEAEAKGKAVLEEAQRQADERRHRAQTIAGLDARKAVLAAKEVCIEDIFKQAIARLRELESEAFEELMHKMLLAASQTGSEEIIVSDHDRARFTDELLNWVNEALQREGKPGTLKMAEETRDIQGGFILSSGDVEINNSFDSLLRMQRDQLEPEVAAVLFND